MAKKKTPPAEPMGKARLELRFDDNIYQGIKRLADDAQISVNQLMQGLARWAIQTGRVGEPYHNEAGHLTERQQAGCVWFGTPASAPPEEYQRHEMAERYGDAPEDYNHWTEGKLLLFLDFTERRVLREDVTPPPKPRGK